MSTLKSPWSIGAAYPSEARKSDVSRRSWLFEQVGLPTSSGLIAAGSGTYLQHAGATDLLSLSLFLVAVVLGAHGRSLCFTIVWIIGCFVLILSSSQAFSLFNFGWFTPNRQIALVAMIGVSGLLLSKWWRGYQLRRPSGGRVSERQELADALPHVIWGTSTDGKCEFLNDRYTETFGINRSNAIKEQTWVNPIHPADLEKMQSAWRSAIGSGNSFYSALARMRMNDGSYRWMESIGRAVRSEETGDTHKWYGCLVDVQNQVEDRETIARLQFDLQAISDERESKSAGSDARLRAIFEPREIGWIDYDVTSVVSLSESLRMKGVVDVGDHLEKHPADIIALSDGLELLNASQHIASSLGFDNFENMITRRRQGSRTVGDVEIAILKALVNGAATTCGIARLVDAEGVIKVFPFTVCILEGGVAKALFLDASVAEEHAGSAGRARVELARVHRVAAASALSASVIHQISQPITAISLDVATATRLIASGESGSAAVGKVMDRLRWNTQRLADVGTSTRETLRSAPQTLEVVDIADLARRSYGLLLDPIGMDQDRLNIVADDEIPLLVADRVALQQVLFALLQNALDARNPIGDPPDISVAISSASRSREIKVTVADRGPGIDRDHTTLVFDPFFSTKPNRLGFGLTVCQNVVEGFGGTLTLTNRPGGGALAQFTIPVR